MDTEWKNDRSAYLVINVRRMTTNYLPMILHQSKCVPAGGGRCAAPSVEQRPWSSAYAELGTDHLTDRVSDPDDRIWFHCAELKSMTLAGGADKPFKPTASVNFKTGDDRLADTVADFQERMGAWDDPAIDFRPNWLLSMSKLNKSGRGAENEGN